MEIEPRVASWFAAAHGEPTEAQRQAWPVLLAREHLLLSSPTGTGKTLAAFVPLLSDLSRADLEARTYVVYLSPLRALATDMMRTLTKAIDELGLDVTVALRTGDTSPSERARQSRRPPHVLLTTPESLALLLSSPQAGKGLEAVRAVVVDEVHALAPTKRGTQLALTLERLEARAGAPFQRIGLSATVAPMEAVARLLCGDRPCRLVEVAPGGAPDIRVRLPIARPWIARPGDVEDASLDAIEAIVLENRTTLVFASTRRDAERVAARLRERLHVEVEDENEASHDPAFAAPEDAAPVAPHHGSMSRESRLVVEERLKREEMRCVVASSSLELGIHVGSIDHVVLLGSPKTAASALQRLGRSGHRVGGLSRCTLLVEDPADLAEALALADAVRARRVEPTRIPVAPLDVLAQHLVGLAVERASFTMGEALHLARRAAPYAELPEEDLERVVDMLVEVRLLAREGGVVRPTRRARLVYWRSAGTIPESGRLRVFAGDRYVGEIEEAFAETLTEGDVFLLAGERWRLLRLTPGRAVVAAARGVHPTVPEWTSEGVSQSTLLARATTWQPLQSQLKNVAGVTLSAFFELTSLQGRSGGLPGPDRALAEAFLHEDGRRGLALHAPAGRRVTEALGRALRERLERALHVGVRLIASDRGLAILGPRGWKPSRAQLLKLLADPIEPDLRSALEDGDLVKRRFRHVATRALALERSAGVSIAMRQMDATRLFAWLTRRAPDHPLLEETWREALHDALDAPGADELRRALVDGTLPLAFVERRLASPLSARLVAPRDEARWGFLRDHHEMLLHEKKALAQAEPS